MFTSAGFWVFVLIVYLLVEGVTGAYVRIKHGADMVGSDYHRSLTLLWTLRTLTFSFIVGFIFCVMVLTVFIDGDFRTYFAGIGRLFGLIWDLVSLIVVSFFKIVFR